MITTQSGLRHVDSKFNDHDLFSNIIKLDDGNIAQWDPMIGGYATFYWTKLPPFMKAGAPDLLERFKNLTQKGHTAFEGISDLTAATEDVVGGMNGNSYKFASNVKDDFDEFTMKVYELQGSPIREAAEWWLTGVRDPKSGYAHYHGNLDIPGGYCARNHTAELIYIVTDPTGTADGIEYACLITNIMITKVPKSHLNVTHGDHPVTQLDLTFSGIKYESEFINKAAVQILKANRVIERYSGYVPKSGITAI